MGHRYGRGGPPFSKGRPAVWTSTESPPHVRRWQCIFSTELIKSLEQNLIRPTKLEIWIMDANGNHKKQVTHLNCASFAPFLAPDDQHIIFSSNYGDPQGREFDLYMINVDGTGLEKITTTPGFDGFPMFTKDGKQLVWCSNRKGTAPHETDVFVADWKS